MALVHIEHARHITRLLPLKKISVDLTLHISVWCKVKASIVDHVHWTTHSSTCNANMDETYIVQASIVKVYVVAAACD